MSSINIRLKNADKVYHPNTSVTGTIVVSANSNLSHQGLTLLLEGTLSLQVSPNNIGLLDAFYNNLKPTPLVQYQVEVVKAGKFPEGVTEVPFEIPLKALDSQVIHETYHGVFVNIEYRLKAALRRSGLSKTLEKDIEFVVENEDQRRVVKAKPVNFSIKPASLENVKKNSLSNIPDFEIFGKLASAVCAINKPLTGELVVQSCDAEIKKIELQLVRVETVCLGENEVRDGELGIVLNKATEIQNVQIAEGDVCRKLVIPIFMVFPRLFTCPTIGTRAFKLEFEVNLIILFSDNHIITENFPIRLVRP